MLYRNGPLALHDILKTKILTYCTLFSKSDILFTLQLKLQQNFKKILIPQKVFSRSEALFIRTSRYKVCKGHEGDCPLYCTLQELYCGLNISLQIIRTTWRIHRHALHLVVLYFKDPCIQSISRKSLGSFQGFYLAEDHQDPCIDYTFH